jgi:mediator of RNA polymerase II transcription subunit 7
MAEEQTQTQVEQPATTIANTLFPPPPAYYKAFTSANLARYAQLGGPSGTSKNRGNPASIEEDQPVAQRDEEEEKEFGRLKTLLSPPRSDWVEEEGRWKCFGETLNVS